MADPQAAFEERHELQRKQKIIARAIERIIERDLCGLEQVKAYLVELYRRNCRPNTLRTHAVTLASFLVYLKGSGRDGLEAIDREAIGGFVEHQQDLGLTPNIYEMAAAYLFHLVRNLPFVDGNKRTAAVAALVFLALNGFDFNASEDDVAETVLAAARGQLAKADVAVFIRRFTGPA